METAYAKKIIDFFPTPKFLSIQPAGLDISDRRVRFLELKKDKHGLTIKHFDKIDIPKGVMVSGEIKKPDELKKILKKLKERNDIEFVNVSLPEEKAYIEKMQVPDVYGDELRNSIMFKLEEYIPIPASSAVVDYTTIPKTNKSKNTKEVMVYVLPKRIAESYANMFLNTGITPASFEIEASSLARAVIPTGDTETSMVVDFGRTRTGISIVDNGILHFTSTSEMGSDMITKAVEKNFSLSPEEAYKMKNEKGMTKNKSDQEFFRAILPTISILRDEINKLYIYWHTHYIGNDDTKRKVKKIILCGGGANLRGLTDYLSVSLKCKVIIADPWINVNSYDEYIPELNLNESLGYSTAIGLAMEVFKPQ